MGQAKQRRTAAERAASLPKDKIACAVRKAVVETAATLGAVDGLCALHAAVGQRLLRDRFKVETAVVAGDLQRRINARVVHSYAQGGTHIDAAAGACHVWLVDRTSKEIIDFDAWEEPKRYASLGSPQGPWTAPQPNYLWTDLEKPTAAIAKVAPDQTATSHVLSRIHSGATMMFVAAAVMKALEYIDVLVP